MLPQHGQSVLSSQPKAGSGRVLHRISLVTNKPTASNAQSDAMEEAQRGQPANIVAPVQAMRSCTARGISASAFYFHQVGLVEYTLKGLSS